MPASGAARHRPEIVSLMVPACWATGRRAPGSSVCSAARRPKAGRNAGHLNRKNSLGSSRWDGRSLLLL